MAISRVSAAWRCETSTERRLRGADRPPFATRRSQNCFWRAKTELPCERGRKPAMFRNVHFMFRNVHLTYQIVPLEGSASAAAYKFVPYTPLLKDFAFTSGNAFYCGCAMLTDNVGRALAARRAGAGASHGMPWHAMPCHAMPCHAMSCHAITCYAMPCHAIQCHAMPCHAIPCHAMPCHAIPCHLMSCHVNRCHVMSWHVLSCHVTSCRVVVAIVVKLYPLDVMLRNVKEEIEDFWGCVRWTSVRQKPRNV